LEDTESDVVLLDNPMHLVFKRTTQGTVMMMLPWLPIELIKDNIATIYTAYILTIVEPKDDLVEYYGNVSSKTKDYATKEHDLLKKRFQELMGSDYDVDEDDELMFQDPDDMDEEISDEDIEELLTRKKQNRLH
jgi:hypothetical protein